MRIRFSGYAVDCTITGDVDLESDRLKDLLDERPEVLVLNATLESLDDGREVCIPRLELDRRDLMAAVAVPPRGPHDRRIHTIRHRMLADVGPYTVSGELHEKPGVAPMTGFHSARPMVSFTDASISFMRAGRAVLRHVDTLIVNREHVLWVGPDTREVPPVEPAAYADPGSAH